MITTTTIISGVSHSKAADVTTTKKEYCNNISNNKQSYYVVVILYIKQLKHKSHEMLFVQSTETRLINMRRFAEFFARSTC